MDIIASTLSTATLSADNIKVNGADISAYINRKISETAAVIYKFRGSVNTSADLVDKEATAVNGDVYNVKDTGKNYAWVSTDIETSHWDDLGGSFANISATLSNDFVLISSDLSTINNNQIKNYTTSANVSSIVEGYIDNIISASTEVPDCGSTMNQPIRGLFFNLKGVGIDKNEIALNKIKLISTKDAITTAVSYKLSLKEVDIQGAILSTLATSTTVLTNIKAINVLDEYELEFTAPVQLKYNKYYKFETIPVDHDNWKWPLRLNSFSPSTSTADSYYGFINASDGINHTGSILGTFYYTYIDDNTMIPSMSNVSSTAEAELHKDINSNSYEFSSLEDDIIDATCLGFSFSLSSFGFSNVTKYRINDITIYGGSTATTTSFYMTGFEVDDNALIISSDTDVLTANVVKPYYKSIEKQVLTANTPAVFSFTDFIVDPAKTYVMNFITSDTTTADWTFKYGVSPKCQIVRSTPTADSITANRLLINVTGGHFKFANGTTTTQSVGYSGQQYTPKFKINYSIIANGINDFVETSIKNNITSSERNSAITNFSITINGYVFKPGQTTIDGNTVMILSAAI